MIKEIVEYLDVRVFYINIIKYEWNWYILVKKWLR